MKLFSQFFNKNIGIFEKLISENLTNDVVSFEQPGPELLRGGNGVRKVRGRVLGCERYTVKLHFLLTIDITESSHNIHFIMSSIHFGLF